jgi:SPP1 family predicted phage head-tail adaptor
MIHAGRMRERVTIQSPTGSQSAMGGSSLTYTDAATVWASVDGISSRDVMQAMQANVIVTHRVRIRYYPGITVDHRLQWRGRSFEIASVIERENRTMHELLVKEVT